MGDKKEGEEGWRGDGGWGRNRMKKEIDGVGRTEKEKRVGNCDGGEGVQRWGGGIGGRGEDKGKTERGDEW